MDEVFDPRDTSWTPVDPALATMRRALLVAVAVPLALVTAGGLGALLGPAYAAAPLLLAVAALAFGWVLVGRNQRSWGYTERAGDLLVRRGVLWRQLVVVPYGRMQFVDVTRGPLERAFGLATVQLHTAAATTDARIPGLRPAEAARLRDRLAALGETRTAGL